MNRPRPNVRHLTKLKIGLVSAILLPVVAPRVVRSTPGQKGAGHPYISPSQIKSQTCLTCHPAKLEGKSVHPAIKLGCDQCHRISSDDQTTTITLPNSGGELCAKCHEPEQFAMPHEPYKSGECLVCHNPHSSDFTAQTRAPADTLCLSCHGEKQPDVKIDSDTKTVLLLGGRTISAGVYATAPKIDEEHHPEGATPALSNSSLGRPAPGPANPRDCFSCHEAHGGKTRYLLRSTR